MKNEFTYGILASGRLGAICIRQLLENKHINFVLTDRGSEDIINLCGQKNIPVFIGNPRNGKVQSFIVTFKTDVILSINYLFIVEQDVISHALKYAVNFHGSLLPKYRGRSPHVWAIINNEKQTGITAHLISDECDAGDIIYQETIEIDINDTGGSILEKFSNRYPEVITQVIMMIEKGGVSLVKQDVSKVTYFGKRTALNGEINWDWQKEQIYNWVRSQARPYPGAYTFYDNKKVIIHSIEYHEAGFHYSNMNGSILNSEQLIIKTSNGAIRLIDIEMEEGIMFKNGGILHARY